MSMGYACECTDLVFRPIIHSIVSNSFTCINRKWKSEIDIFQRMINSLILIFSAAVLIEWVASTNNQSHCYGPVCLCEYKTILLPLKIWIDRIIVSIGLRPQYTTRTLFCTYCGLYSHHSWASPGVVFVSLTFPFSFFRGLLSIVDCFSVKSYLLLNNIQKKANPGSCLKVSEKDFSLTGTFIVSCYWEDERIHWKPGHHLKSPHYALQKHVASKLWIPKMRASFCRSNFWWLFKIRFNMWKAARTTLVVFFSTRDSLWTTWAESFS